jgi:hypothetical protein
MMAQNKGIIQTLRNAIDNGVPIVDGGTILPYKSPVKFHEPGKSVLKDDKRVFIGKNKLPGVFNLLVRY